MQQFEDIARQVYGNSSRKNFSSSIAIDKLSSKQEDEILDHYSQLIDPNYRSWFIVKLREIGKHRFTSLADRSIKYGRDPQKMFSSLLR